MNDRRKGALAALKVGDSVLVQWPNGVLQKLTINEITKGGAMRTAHGITLSAQGTILGKYSELRLFSIDPNVIRDFETVNGCRGYDTPLNSLFFIAVFKSTPEILKEVAEITKRIDSIIEPFLSKHKDLLEDDFKCGGNR